MLGHRMTVLTLGIDVYAFCASDSPAPWVCTQPWHVLIDTTFVPLASVFKLPSPALSPSLTRLPPDQGRGTQGREFASIISTTAEKGHEHVSFVLRNTRAPLTN